MGQRNKTDREKNRRKGVKEEISAGASKVGHNRARRSRRSGNNIRNANNMGEKGEGKGWDRNGEHEENNSTNIYHLITYIT